MTEPLDIEYLSLGAGGVRGIAHLGALDALTARDPGWEQKLRVVFGSSIGSFIALILALGHHPTRVLLDRALPAFSPVFGTEPGRRGLFSHADLKASIAELLRDLGVQDPLTLRLRALSRPELWVLTQDVATKEKRVWKPQTDPDVPVVDLICASMSPTPFFPAVRLQGKLYSDAGGCPSGSEYFGSKGRSLTLCLHGGKRKRRRKKKNRTPDPASTPTHLRLDIRNLKRVALGNMCLSRQQRQWLYDQGYTQFEEFVAPMI